MYVRYIETDSKVGRLGVTIIRVLSLVYSWIGGFQFTLLRTFRNRGPCLIFSTSYLISRLSVVTVLIKII